MWTPFLLLLACQKLQSDAAAWWPTQLLQAQPRHAYAPHAPPARGVFVEGWYTRATLRDHSSVSIIIGQYVAEEGEAAAREPKEVLCMVMQQPVNAAPRSHSTYLSTLSIDESKRPQPPQEQQQQQEGAGCQCPAADSDIQHPLDMPTFTATAASAATCPSLAVGRPAEGTAGECSISTSPTSFTVHANLPGIVKMSISSSGTGADACFLPWSTHSTFAEGWAHWLGRLIGVHYAMGSMRTPVRVVSEWAPGAGMHAAGVAAGGAAAAAGAGAGDATDGAGLHTDALAVAHTESQWGSGFPPGWLWAQGTGFSAPDDAYCGKDAGGVSFVIAGGDLPVEVPFVKPPHLFLFSYRDTRTGQSFNVSPDNPGVSSEQVDSCGGTFTVRIVTWTHVFRVTLRAPPDDFFDCDCPTPEGFKPWSAEAFSAHASIRIYSRAGFAEGRTGQVGQEGGEDSSRLVASAEVPGAAMEYGGDYRCGNSTVASRRAGGSSSSGRSSSSSSSRVPA